MKNDKIVKSKRLSNKGKLRGKMFAKVKSIPTGMPNITKVRLRYVDAIPIVPTSAGTPRFYLFRANDLYDPDYSGTGHQPLYFDQYMANYNHFTVLGSRIRVTPVPDSYGTTTTGLSGVLGVGIVSAPGDASNYTTVSQCLESNQLKSDWRVISNSNYSTTNARTNTITKTFSLKKFFGKVSSSQDVYRGSESASPTEQSFFAIWYNSPTVQASGITIMVEIEYYAVLTEPKYITNS